MAWNVVDAEALAELDQLRELGPPDLMRVARLMTVERYRRDQLVVAEGSPSDRLYFIRAGAVRVSRAVPGVGEEALAILHAGSCFGEMALFGGPSARSADVYADTASVLLSVEIDDLRALLDADHRLAARFLWGASRALAERLREANAKVLFLSAAGVFG